MGFSDELRTRAKTEEELEYEQEEARRNKRHEYVLRIYKEIQDSILSQAEKAQYTYKDGKKQISNKVPVLEFNSYVECVTLREYTTGIITQYKEPIYKHEKAFWGKDKVTKETRITSGEMTFNTR